MNPESAKNPLELQTDIGPAKVERGIIRSIRSRIISGLVLALPIAITFWIVYQLYSAFRRIVLDPVASMVRSLVGKQTFDSFPAWWDQFVAPLIAILVVAIVLYILGYFARSRLHKAMDWVMLHVPVVTTIYKTVNNVFQSLDTQAHGFKRVVLVEFPHPGSRALAFVTNSLRDTATGQTILSVCVLTGVMPPAGFTLFVPEESVTDIDWTVNQTLQAIISGGITAPATVPYFRDGGSREPLPSLSEAHRPSSAAVDVPQP
jgi:uncharacterized membrane protein